MRNYNLEIDGMQTNISVAFAIRALYYQMKEFRDVGKIPAERVIDIYFETGYQYRFYNRTIEDVCEEFIGWRKYFKFLVKKRLKDIDKLEEFVVQWIVKDFTRERELENDNVY